MKIDPDSYDSEEVSLSKKKMKNFKTIKSYSDLIKGCKLGRLTFVASDLFHVNYKSQVIPCTIKGTLKKELKQNKDRLSCGDFVYFDLDKKQIVSLKPRTTVLMRENPSQKHRNQILATNIDTLLITASLREPLLNPYFIDLYLITAQRANLNPIIVINKTDLKTDDLDERDLLKQLIKQYKQLNIPLVCMSAKQHQGFDELKTIMKDKASVFAGQSGVGKSSLINEIIKTYGIDALKVSPVSEKNQKGTHTTTTSMLIELVDGGYCVDTPGIQSLSFNEIKVDEIKGYFCELNDIGCQYNDCLHINEEGCQIERALERKQVSPLRLKSYHRLLEEIKKDKK